MKHYKDEDSNGATFIDMQQSFHYHKWDNVITLDNN